MSRLPADEQRGRMEQEDRQPHPPTDRGNTVRAQGETQKPKARMPHERDESSDSQAADGPGMERMGTLAHDDVVEGHQDTSKAQETDATYHRLREDAKPAPVDRANKNQR